MQENFSMAGAPSDTVAGGEGVVAPPQDSTLLLTFQPQALALWASRLWPWLGPPLMALQ